MNTAQRESEESKPEYGDRICRTAMKTNHWSVKLLTDAVPGKCVLQRCSIYSDPLHIGVLCTQVILTLHLALLDTCFNSWYLSDLLLFILFLFSRAWPLALILLHAVFHTHSPSLSVSPSLSLTDTCIHVSPLSFLLSLFLTATGVMLPYILHQLINGLAGDSYNTPANLFCQSPQVSNFIATQPTSDVWLFLTLSIYHCTAHTV